MAKKPLGRKGYGHIPHLPCSRMGPGDHKISEGQERICTRKARDRHDFIIVQEKLDGSNVCVAKHEGEIIPITRAGYHCNDSRFRQHHLFADWVDERETLFDELLEDGERVVGEWLILAHGTRYNLPHEPFVAFDIMRGTERLTYTKFVERVHVSDGLVVPRLLSLGPAFSVEDMLTKINNQDVPSPHGAIDPVEGAVWRVERHGKVDFLAKYVRPEKVDGKYLEMSTGAAPIWNNFISNSEALAQELEEMK